MPPLPIVTRGNPPADGATRPCGDAVLLATGFPRRIEPTGSVHRIVRNSVFNAVINGVSAVSYMAIFIALARGLKTAAMGEYYMLFALILVVQLVFEMGVPTVLTGRIARDPSRLRQTLAEAASLQTISVAGQIFVFVVAGIVAAWLFDDSAKLVRCLLAACATSAIQVQRFCAGVFRGFELFKFENITRLCQGASLAISVVVLITLGVSNLSVMIAVLAASHIFAALYMIVSLARRYAFFGWCWNPARMRDWLAEAIPLGISESIRGQAWQMDTVLLGLLQPAAVVGLYSVAYRPLTVLNWLPLAAAAATFPMLVRVAGSPAQFNQAVANSTRMLLISALPLAVVISLGAEYLVTTLAGSEYLAAALPMRILVWKILLSSLAILYRLVFAALGKLPALARIILLGAALDAAAELVLIPVWGYLGACCGSLIGEIAFDLMALAACRALGIKCIEWRLLAGAVLAAVGMAASLSFARGTPLPIFLLAAGGATVLYFVLCLVTGALSWSELRHFSDAIRGRTTSHDLTENESELDEAGAMTATGT